ncbi:MAG: hypothetical protein JW878_00855 [Methanomicrobia archaeon]|nr:hypothetical protein [Methanomicrobia archaeon]
MRKAKFFGYLATALLLVLIVFSLACISKQSMDDREFEEWYSATMTELESAATTMASAIENFDCTTCEAGARSGYDIATLALEELEGSEVSSEMQPVKSHLTLALENFKVGCEYIESGAMEYDPDDLETAAGYISSAANHFREIDALGLVPSTPVAVLKRLQGDLEQAVQTLRSTST